MSTREAIQVSDNLHPNLAKGSDTDTDKNCSDETSLRKIEHHYMKSFIVTFILLLFVKRKL